MTGEFHFIAVVQRVLKKQKTKQPGACKSIVYTARAPTNQVFLSKMKGGKLYSECSHSEISPVPNTHTSPGASLKPHIKGLSGTQSLVLALSVAVYFSPSSRAGALQLIFSLYKGESQPRHCPKECRHFLLSSLFKKKNPLHFATSLLSKNSFLLTKQVFPLLLSLRATQVLRTGVKEFNRDWGELPDPAPSAAVS